MTFFCATNTATYTNSCIDALIKTRKLNTYLLSDVSPELIAAWVKHYGHNQ